MSTGQRATAVMLLICAVCGAVGLTELRHALDYPKVLSAPPADTLALVREHWLAIGIGVVLAGVAAGLLLPITVGIVRLLPRGPHRPLLTVLGAATAGAHLTGLLFWLITVPALARRAAVPTQADHATAVFDTARTLFGVMIGEVLACLLTASWTVALLTRAARAATPRRPPLRSALPKPAAVALAGWGGLAAGGVLGGVLLPFGVDAAITGRVVGELLWYLWLVGLAVAVWHLDPRSSGAPPTAAPVARGPASPAERVIGDQAHPGPPPGRLPSGAAHPTPAARPAPTARSATAGDAFFDAATEIFWKDPTAGDGPDRRPLRAATQPAGRLLGDDAPTDPAIEADGRVSSAEPPAGRKPARD